MTSGASSPSTKPRPSRTSTGMRPILICAFAICAACFSANERGPDSGDVGAADTSSLRQPAPAPGLAAGARPSSTGPLPDSRALVTAFQAFLDSSVATHQDSGTAFRGRATRCEADQIIPDVDYLLALGQVLAVVRRTPELATMRAALTVVGEDSLSAAGVRQIRVGVHTDTVEWDLAPDSSGTWVPCGYASSDRDIGRMGTRQFPARWIPAGAGWGTVARLSDSVRRAHGRRP